MSAHEFTMVVEGVDLDVQDAEVAALEERCEGLTWGESDGQVVVTAEVSGKRLVGAVTEAITAVESIPGARVMRVGPDQYVSQAEIARRIGVSRQYVSLLASGARGPGDFPAPAVGSGRSAIWQWPAVADWLVRSGLSAAERNHDDAVFAAVNATLEARRAGSTLSGPEQAVLRGFAAA
jgi:hypothetical protein